MTKILMINSDGSYGEIQPIISSAGSGDAGKIAQLDGNGKYDVSLMPTGIGADTQSMISSDTLAAGDFVHIYNNAGTRNCQKALAADNTKPANGFVLAGVAALGTAIVYVRGLNSMIAVGSFTAADQGHKAFLSPSVSGGATNTMPTTTGQISQVLGTIDSVGSYVTINFTEETFVVRA